MPWSYSPAWWQAQACSASAMLTQSTASTAHGCSHSCWTRCLPACPSCVGVRTASTHLYTTPVASCTRYQLPSSLPERPIPQTTATQVNTSHNWSESTLGPNLICCTEPQWPQEYNSLYHVNLCNSIYIIPYISSVLYNTVLLKAVGLPS